MVKADPDEKLSGLELGELARLDFHRMGVLEGRGETLNLYPLSTYSLNQGLKVR